MLIDTYDTLAAAKRLAEQVKSGTRQVTGVRIDSGDLLALSKQVRSLLPNTQIFVSGDLDEWEIDCLQQADAPIDGYGIGTKLVTGFPVNGVYKLVEIDDIPTMKLATNKVTYPGRKQIFRSDNQDRLGLANETPAKGEKPLLELVMKQGKSVAEAENLATIQQRTLASVNSLPAQTRQLNKPISMPVEISTQLQELQQLLMK